MRSLTKNFSLFLALRYLKPKRTFVSIITLISVLGVSLGVAVLIIVISVMSGFEEKIKETVLGFEPHIMLVKQHELQLPRVDEPDFFAWDFDATGKPIRPAGMTEQEYQWNLKQMEDYEKVQALRVANRWDTLQKKIEEIDNVLEATPYVQGRVMMEIKKGITRKRDFPMMLALDPEDSIMIRQIEGMMGKGIDDGELNLRGKNIIIGRARAEELGLEVNDEVDIDSSKQMEMLINEFKDIYENDDLTEEERSKRLDSIEKLHGDMILTVVGIFDSLQYEDFVFIPLPEGQILYEFNTESDMNVANDVHGLSIHVKDPYKAREVEAALKSAGLIPRNWATQTWMDKHKLTFDTIRNERSMMYFVLFCIVIVAAFSIMNTMITVTVQKRKEIGVMKALGAREMQIIWVFLVQGFVVGVMGTIVGCLLGYGVLLNREGLRSWLGKSFGMEIFPETMYGVSSIPASYNLVDICIISIGAIVLCTIAALLPAWFAARLDPARALRE